MTASDAQRLQDDARRAGRWAMWFVSAADPDHPGKTVAWAITADPHGGTRHPGVLAADTLEDLHAMLPRALTRSTRTSVMPPEIIETWD